MFELREATATDQVDVRSLIAEMIPGADVGARWRWMYEANPGGRALTWIATSKGEVAGCTSLFPFRVWLDGEQLRAALGGDGFVRPKFRRQGLGGLLHDASRKAMRAHGIGCMFGAPGAANLTPLKHGGSRALGDVSRFVRPLRAGPALVGGLFGRATKPRFAPRLEPMVDRDLRVDTVWLDARRDLRLATVRDARFYNWRFREAPAQRQIAYVILDRDRPIGTCALESIIGGHELRIIDLVALSGAWHACLSGIVRHAIDATRAQIVSLKLFAIDGRRRTMWRSGFLERDRKPFLCMIPTDGDRRFVDPQRWFYSGADGDMDTLEEQGPTGRTA